MMQTLTFARCRHCGKWRTGCVLGKSSGHWWCPDCVAGLNRLMLELELDSPSGIDPRSKRRL